MNKDRIKRSDYPNVKMKKNFINKHFDNQDFKGNICLLEAFQVEKKLYLNDDTEKIVVLDDNFKWLEFFPDDNKNVAMSVAINDKDEIIDWYFDVAKDSSVDKDGIPYILDLYLDVILYPSGKIEMLDEDELKEALEINDITKEEYDFAYKVANEIIEKIDGKNQELISFTKKYLSYMY